MSEKIYSKCWEMLDCPMKCRENCEVWKQGKGEKCWTVKEEFKKNGKTLEGCLECKFYKYQNRKAK